MPACDAVVVGSDEVWNLSHPWYGGRPLFYGEGLGTPRLVAYAASFGHHDASTPLEAPWSRRLSRFHRIAVRDSASQATVERAIGTATPIVLDPCLQFPPEVECTTHRPERGYVAVYGHGFTPAFVAQVRRWAKANALLVASIGYRNDWADRQWIDAGPRDFAGFMAGASAVATNFFHGCVFALRFARPFVCEPSWYRSTKLRCLLQDLHGQDHLLEGDAPPAQIDRLLREPLGADIQRRIVQRRRRSLRYLERALGTGARRA